MQKSGSLVECAGIDVPGVVVFRFVYEGLELVAAGVRSECFEVAALVKERRDAAGLRVDSDAEGGVFECIASAGEIGVEVVRTVHRAEHGVADRGDAVEFEEQMKGVSGKVARDDL